MGDLCSNFQEVFGGEAAKDSSSEFAAGSLSAADATADAEREHTREVAAQWNIGFGVCMTLVATVILTVQGKRMVDRISGGGQRALD
eukprot:SAG22_NODE_15285_length_352_cov_0.992095_1_plen_86_part_10